jgi:hypothetical protein
MRIEELQRRADQGRVRYVGAVADAAGEEGYELAIAGPEDLVEEAFAETDFALDIRPGASREDWDRMMEDMARSRAESSTEAFALERPDEFFKPAPCPAVPETTAMVALRRLCQGGTVFGNRIRFGIPRGAETLVFTLPSVWICSGTLIPQSGDADLFLSLNHTGAPFQAHSSMPGTTTERVQVATTSDNPFVPFFTVTGLPGTITIFEFVGLSGEWPWI